MRTTKIPEEIAQAVICDLKKGCSNYAELARKHGISRAAIYRFRKVMNTQPTSIVQDGQLYRARESATSSTRKYKTALKQINDLETQLNLYKDAKDLMNVCTPKQYIMGKSTATNEATPILVASDWHIDEVVVGSEIGYANEFNPAVAQKRVEKLFTSTAKLISICKQDSKVETLVIAALGDFMSSWIHDELIETNSMTPPEAIQTLFEMWIGGLDFLLGTGLVKKIRFIGAVGNHARITPKIQFKNRVKKSYEWLLYNLLAHHYSTRGETRIEFQLPTGYFNWLTLYGQNIRFHHGDNLRYCGGIGGVTIPVRKAIAQWNKIRPADLDVFGHWHTEEWSRSYVINNSLIGFNTFAENLKADYNKAGQAFFLMHPKFGKTAMYNIKLQD